MDQLLEKIKEHNVITFDVFDTLLKRPFSDQRDIFMSVAEQLHSNNIIANDFAKERENAEKTARKVFPEREVNIHEIYTILEKKYGKDVCEKIKKIEIDTEINAAMPNMEVYPYYQQCILLKKKIYIISDMYLPGTVIEKILSHIGIDGYNKLYSSCDYRKTKWENGDLFDVCLKENKINPSEVLHIGDNPRADIKMAKKKGIDAYCVGNVKCRIGSQYTSAKFILSQKNKQYYKRLKNFINNSIPQREGIAFRTGYEIFGPLLCHYIMWLQSIVHSNKIDKIIFFSRDGYVLKKAYDLLHDNKVSTEYLYISRRAVIVPLLSYTNTLEDFFYLYKSWPKKIKIRHFIDRLGLIEDDIEEELKKYGYRLEDAILYQDVLLDNNFREFFNEIRPKFIHIADKQKSLFQQYFTSTIKKDESFTVVDIGGRCTIEYALNDFFKRSHLRTQFYASYFLMNDYHEQTARRKTCYKSTPLLNAVLRFSYMFLEVFLSAPHGTVLSYKQDTDNRIIPVLGPYIYDDANLLTDSKAILDLQEGALSFVRNYANGYKKYIPLNQEIAFAGYCEFSLFPVKNDIEYWKRIHFDGDEFEPLVSRKNIMSYINHPSAIKDDFYKSMWPAGFITDLFKTKLPLKILFLIYYKLHK
ncbi:HAD family hydrolase [Mitsuokella multacida]|uniref:HAD family hydrolase n=1 Tax=Mitsuokella multacida TaxID=52226 RepID=UPI001F307946|nr:HAD family hydrolase [Mitsuokella multacida]MCF2583983.1 HAD hydrolase-like protein [Mitsuokella multacida]